MAPFRFQSSQLFATYSQCTLTKEVVLQWFQENHTVEAYCICLENHAEEGTHIHAYIKFNRKLDLSDERCFDIGGFHPNIQRPRSPKFVCDYIQKVSQKNPKGILNSKLINFLHRTVTLSIHQILKRLSMKLLN